MNQNSKYISIVIPVYNEADYIAESVTDLISQLESASDIGSWQIIFVENGSSDNSYECLKNLETCFQNQITVICNKKADYGLALKTGILAAQSDFVYTFNSDYWDVSFIKTTLPLLHNHSIIIGSKGMKNSCDLRPFYRRVVSNIFIVFLKALLGYPLHDTHGIIAWKRTDILPILHKSKYTCEIFDTEIIVRAIRAGLSVYEVPVKTVETRPTRSSLVRRSISSFLDIIRFRRDLWKNL